MIRVNYSAFAPLYLQEKLKDTINRPVYIRPCCYYFLL